MQIITSIPFAIMAALLRSTYALPVQDVNATETETTQALSNSTSANNLIVLDMATKESALNATILEEYEDEDGEEDIEFGLMTLPFEDEDGEGDFEFGLMARSETPPKDTTLAAAIEMFDLPQCYSTCMQQEDGKFSIHMGKDTLKQYCKTKIYFFDWWLEYSIRPCVKKRCKEMKEEDPHKRAREWHKDVCGKYPQF